MTRTGHAGDELDVQVEWFDRLTTNGCWVANESGNYADEYPPSTANTDPVT